MKTRIVHTKLWKDAFYCDLTPSEKLLFIYYLTNERVNIIHCYEITDREVTFDTGINTSTIEVFKKKMVDAQKMFFNGDFVYLYNATKYENYLGAKNEAAKEKLVNEMSQKIKDWYISIKNTPINTPINGGMYTPSIGSINHKSEIINNKSNNINDNNNDTKSEKKETNDELTINDKAKWVLETFNEVFGKKLKSHVALTTNLQYWLESGYTANDIKNAIKIAKYDEYWRDKLTPVILLRRKNTRGEDVDYIGQFLAKDQQYKPRAKRVGKSILEQLADKGAK